MKELEMIENGNYDFECIAGITNVIVNDDVVYMEQQLPEYGEKIFDEEIVKSLNISEEVISFIDSQKVSTGLFDIMIGIKSLKDLKSITPNFEEISRLSYKYDSVGYHLFTIEDNNIYTRNFAPRYAINEESATGSASGALACLLSKYNLIEFEKEYVFLQGYFMNQPSNIYVKLSGENDISKVLVGGSVGKFKKSEYK